MTEKKRYTYLNASKTKYIGSFFCNDIPLTNQEVVELLKENEQLKEELADANELKEHLDYYKTKCGSLEENLIQKEREISMLKNTVGKIKVLDELIWWNSQKRRLKK